MKILAFTMTKWLLGLSLKIGYFIYQRSLTEQTTCILHSNLSHPCFWDFQNNSPPHVWHNYEQQYHAIGLSFGWAYCLSKSLQCPIGLIFWLTKACLKSGSIISRLLCFCNSCQLCLHLCLSCDYLSTNSIPRHDSWLPYYLCPSVHSDIPPRFSELLSSLTLCHYYLVIISEYQLGLFTLHFNPQLCISGYGHAWNNLYYLSHVYSMSQKFLVVIFLSTHLS